MYKLEIIICIIIASVDMVPFFPQSTVGMFGVLNLMLCYFEGSTFIRMLCLNLLQYCAQDPLSGCGHQEEERLPLK